MDRPNLLAVKDSLRQRIAFLEFTPAEASEILKEFTEVIMTKTRVVAGRSEIETPLHQAERYLDCARLDIGKSPLDENFIDCLDSIIQHLKGG